METPLSSGPIHSVWPSPSWRESPSSLVSLWAGLAGVLDQEALPQSVAVAIVLPRGAVWDPAGALHASVPIGASDFFIPA